MNPDEFFRRNDINKIIDPVVLREALYGAGITALKGAFNSLSAGRSPIEDFKRIERWLDELQKTPRAENNHKLMRARYLTLQGEALLKQGMPPMRPLDEALALYAQLEARKMQEISWYRGYVYLVMVNYQLLLRNNIIPDRAEIDLYVDRLEGDKYPWLWKQPVMLRFYLSLAQLELHEGRDPAAALKRLEGAMARCQQLGSCVFGEQVAGQGELVRVRWLLRAAHPDAAAIEASLATAYRHLSAALRIGNPAGGTYRVAAELARWQAEWALRQKRPSAPFIQEGLQLAARAQALDPTDQEALAVEGALHLLAARAVPGTADGRRSAQIAAARITEALAKNALLRDGYEPLQRDAARIVAAAPGRVAPPAAGAVGLR